MQQGIWTGVGWRRWVCLIVFCAAIFTLSLTSWGRAGGGDSYHGSSRSSHSSGSSGFHGGGGIYVGGGGAGTHLSTTAIVIILIIIVIIVVIKMKYGSRGGADDEEDGGDLIMEQGDHPDQAALAAGLGELCRRDPAFNPEQFCGRVKTAFQQIQSAWAGRDMKPVRHFVSDGIYERYSLQLEIMKGSGVTNRLDGLEIHEATIAAINSDPCYDAIDVYICADVIDWYVDDAGKTVGGSQTPNTFGEFWTFIRRPGAKTLTEHGGLTEHVCPNCGAPLEIVDRCECPVCKAMINSGEYDWVLTEITQECEWKNRPPKAIAGNEALLAQDPGFNVRHLEDRVSVMFYRWIAAQFFADPKYLRKLATDTFLAQQAGFFRPQEDGSHLFYADAAIGRVETAEVVCASELNQVRVQVKWSGHRLRAKVPGLIVPNSEESHLFNQEYVLIRQAGVKSSSRNAMAGAHCPNCGAPETINDSGRCEYCQTPLNDGSRDWALAEVRNFSGFNTVAEAGETLAAAVPDEAVGGVAFLDEKDGESLIAVAASMMLADGAIDPQEEQLLQRFAQQRKMKPERLHAIVEAVRCGEMQVTLPAERSAAVYFLRCLILSCLADGKIVPEERKQLCALAAQMNIPFKEVEMMIKEEKQRLQTGA